MINEKTVSMNEEKIVDYIKDLGIERAKDINVSKIKEDLKTQYIGQKIYAFQKVDSTNVIAKFLAGTGIEEGTIVIARSQIKGKGRMGKKWESPLGGIWLSIILNPKMNPEQASLITLGAGVAVTKAIRGLGVDVRIKWPNDILIGDKKIAGILTEANSRSHTLDYIVVGIGIDSNIDSNSISKKTKVKSTTLKDELKKNINENKLITNLLKEFENIYEHFKSEEFEEILYEWRNLSQTIGSYVVIEQPFGRVLKGYVVGINNQGSLILELNNGKLKKIISGESHITEISKSEIEDKYTYQIS
ncbi:MAG: biotin--[acetyl-CoA-carboxylase] ligase [Methanobrevibacter sp.]|nr:biotin--[acetyl-CoA-carboxylase] ligase [Candidatus Methanovirga basalitermitum]